MRLQESTIIPGLKTVWPESFHDFRGEFLATFTEREYGFRDLAGNPVRFVEDDISVSRQHVLRGLHGDEKTWKLVQCLHGAIFYAVVDLRRDSPAYLRAETFSLSDRNRLQVLVPAGCANGHLVLSDLCVFSYKQSEYYSGAVNQFTIRWDDPKLGIPWPIRDPLVSQRDRSAAFLP